MSNTAHNIGWLGASAVDCFGKFCKLPAIIAGFGCQDMVCANCEKSSDNDKGDGSGDGKHFDFFLLGWWLRSFPKHRHIISYLVKIVNRQFPIL